MPNGLGLKKIESSPFIDKPKEKHIPSPMKEFRIEEEPSHLEQTQKIIELPKEFQRLQVKNTLQTAKTILQELDEK